MSKTDNWTVGDFLNEVVLYGGIPVRRIDVYRHLESVGVDPQGPAIMAYSRLPVVDVEPEQYWDKEKRELVDYEH